MSVANLPEQQLKELLEGQTFKFRLSLHDCVSIRKLPMYAKFVITTKKFPLVLLPSELDEIVIMKKVDKNEKLKKELAEKLNVVQGIKASEPHAVHRPLPSDFFISSSSPVKRAPVGKIAEELSKVKVFVKYQWLTWEDDLIKDSSNTTADLVKALKRTPETINKRRYYLKNKDKITKSQKDSFIKKKKEEKNTQPRKSNFTPEQDAKILKNAEVYGSSAKLAQEFECTRMQITQRRWYLINKKEVKIEAPIPVEEIFNIGNCVRGLLGEEGVVVGFKQNMNLTQLVTIQIVNPTSFSKRGQLSTYGKDALTKISRICHI